MRQITLKIEDSSSNISGTITLDAVNSLWDNHEINGITQLLLTLNDELNKLTQKTVNISIPNELNILPKGKNW